MIKVLEPGLKSPENSVVVPDTFLLFHSLVTQLVNCMRQPERHLHDSSYNPQNISVKESLQMYLKVSLVPRPFLVGEIRRGEEGSGEY